MDEPKPIGVIANGQSLQSRTVELVMVRADALSKMEGAEVLVCAGARPLGHGGFLRVGATVRVLAVDDSGDVHVLLSDELPRCVPAVATGDALYLASETAEWAERDAREREAREVAAWKAERRSKR